MNVAATVPIPRDRPKATALRKVVLVGPGGSAPGGQAVQVRALTTHLREAGVHVTFLALSRPFPRFSRWVRRWRYARTMLNEALYVPALRTLKGADAAV